MATAKQKATTKDKEDIPHPGPRTPRSLMCGLLI